MKRFVLLVSILCLSALFAWPNDEGQPISIYILDYTVETGTTHRDSIAVPILGYYDVFSSTVRVLFLQNIGEVDVTITNLSSGYYEEYDVDSSIGITVIPVDGGNGLYHITFLLSNGGGYEGEFEVF